MVPRERRDKLGGYQVLDCLDSEFLTKVKIQRVQSHNLTGGRCIPNVVSKLGKHVVAMPGLGFRNAMNEAKWIAANEVLGTSSNWRLLYVTSQVQWVT